LERRFDDVLKRFDHFLRREDSRRDRRRDMAGKDPITRREDDDDESDTRREDRRYEDRRDRRRARDDDSEWTEPEPPRTVRGQLAQRTGPEFSSLFVNYQKEQNHISWAENASAITARRR
jgi:hypothetical protein